MGRIRSKATQPLRAKLARSSGFGEAPQQAQSWPVATVALLAWLAFNKNQAVKQKDNPISFKQ